MSYAPRLAHNHIEKNALQISKKEIDNLDVISVREKRKSIINKITNKEVSYVLDSTSLLKKDDYIIFMVPLKFEKSLSLSLKK